MANRTADPVRSFPWVVAALLVLAVGAPAAGQTQPYDPNAPPPPGDIPPEVIIQPVGPESPPPSTNPPPPVQPPPGMQAPPVQPPPNPPPVAPDAPPVAPDAPPVDPDAPPVDPDAPTAVEDPPPPAGDPGWTQLEALPTARTLREGDVYAHYIGYMGAFGLQYGINGDVDVGAGLTFFTIDLAAKYAFYHNDYMSIAAFAELIFPFYRNYWPMSALGLDYLMLIGIGPLFSLWSDKAELDVGLAFVSAPQWHKPQCVTTGSGSTATTTCDEGAYDADFLVMPWVAGRIRLGDFASMLLGFVHLALLGLDDWTCDGTPDDQNRCPAAEGWQHSTTSRNYPTALLGFRFHTDALAVDFGLHFPLHPDWWNYIDWLIAIPWLTIGHLW